MLHITNGDIAAELLRQSGLGGEVLPWQDVLHEGPVPEGLPLQRLSPLRARFIADRGWGEYHDVMEQFARRDHALGCAAEHEEVVLWFEHDLYDQLQLLQLLDHFAAHPPHPGRLSLVLVDSYPGVERFMGLGQLEPAQLAGLYDLRLPVDEAQLASAREGWAAFRAPDPRRLEAWIAGGADALPLAAAALRRHLEEFPSTRNGLGCTERRILSVMAAGLSEPEQIFRAVQDLEPAPFMGDTVFWHHLAGLAAGPEPLLRRADHAAPVTPGATAGKPRLVLTEQGEAVRRDQADWIRLRGGIDRWLGGVHLHGAGARWRWDPERGGLTDAEAGDASPRG